MLSFLLMGGLSASNVQLTLRWAVLTRLALDLSYVDGSHDHNHIKVSSGDGPFRVLVLQVDGAPGKFDHILVHYGNGQQQRVPAGFIVRAKSDGPAMNLSGKYRNIRDVEMW